jgi:3-keto steroid reductase
VASFSHINWWAAAKQLLTDLVVAVSTPRYNVSNIGERSIDGLGWVWQCNIFGHYALIRELQPRLEASAHTPLGPARVLWMSSLEALPMAYDVGDWQLVKAYENYALSKYQIDLIGTRLDADAVVSGKTNAPRHIVVQPGVAATSIVNSYHNWFTVFWMNVFFWLVRIFI